MPGPTVGEPQESPNEPLVDVGGAGDEMPPAGTTGPAEARYDDSARAIKQGEEGEA